MTKKQKFEVDSPNVVVLKNGRYAYKTLCPWQGKNGKDLYAFKFCSVDAWEEFKSRKETENFQEDKENVLPGKEQDEGAESDTETSE